MEIFVYVIGVISSVAGLIVTIDKLTEIFGGHSKNFAKKNREKMVEKFKPVFEELMPKYLEPIKNELAEMKHVNSNQSKRIEVLEVDELEILRREIEDIYYTNRKDRTLSIQERTVLEEKFDMYSKKGGNHGIHTLYEEMKKWGNK